MFTIRKYTIISHKVKATKSVYTKINKRYLNRRVLFNVPGSDTRKLDKISKLDLDCVVLDFEDGVSQNEKDIAREFIPQYLNKDDSFFQRAERSVRINAFGSGHEMADLNALVGVLDRVQSVVLPKVENAEHVVMLDDFLSENGDSEKRIKILAAIESASGLLNLKDICQSSSRLDALIFASEDFSADVGITRTPDTLEFLYARSQIVLHSAAYNLQSIDMVCIDYKNQEQLQKECIGGYNLGFTGKQAIHPGQIQPIYEYFCPPQEKIDFAKEILSSHEEHEARGIGAFEVRGKMIDLPMVKWARKTLGKANIRN
eukprot:TRINITY_DN1879_c0_g1_i1.p1 TRINITY_DN1879_c0_g1~~TRINITY_DN1879_c0_g1_i1.p1  ORF type:complete len:316 (+),score=66.06 TRINITY_DN1879_c0_g1_i1:11-958(+)